MQFAFTEEQEEFRSMLRRFLVDKSPTTEVRRLMESDTGMDLAVWQQLSQQLGLTAVHIPEDYGGQGYGIVELAITLEEMGRALLCAPYFSSVVLAATAILQAGTETQKRNWLPAIAAGDVRATLAYAEENSHGNLEEITTTAISAGGGYRLDGVKNFVLDGHTADMVVVLARTDSGLSFFTVDGQAEGLLRQSLMTVDPTRKLAKLSFHGVEADLLGNPGAAAPAMQQVLHLAAVCLANEMVGGAERLREDTMDYIRMRVQFGRAVGSFQSLKHTAADMLADVELAKSAAYCAAEAAAANDPDLPGMASLAKAAASDAYMQTAIHAIQMHGGIGFTWDNDTHLWYKRAKSSEVLFGDAAYHREQLMQAWNV